MKQVLFTSLLLTISALTSPCYAQSVVPASSLENCSNFCINLDAQSGYSNSIDLNKTNNIRWQLSLTWRSPSLETVQVEEQIAKQQLESNMASIVKLAEAISQNNTPLANGLAIVLAPKLGYKDPQMLISHMKAKVVTIDLSAVK